MSQLITTTALVVLFFAELLADTKPAEKPGRAERLKTIQGDYAKARDEFGKAIRAGTIKPNAEGEYPGWADLLKRFTKPARELIDADPTDAVALDALVFCLNDLGAGDA